MIINNDNIEEIICIMNSIGDDVEREEIYTEGYQGMVDITNILISKSDRVKKYLVNCKIDNNIHTTGYSCNVVSIINNLKNILN